MKYLLVISFLMAVCAASTIKDLHKDPKQDQRSIPEDGTLNLAEDLQPVDTTNMARNPEDNEYRLFTRLNPTAGQLIRLLDAESMFVSNFRPLHNVVILVHGYNGNGGDAMSTSLTAAFLEEADVNVIVLDWRRLANRNYITAKNGVPAVGRHLGQLVNWLVSSFGASYERIHLVGFSLGAHVVGSAGRETRSLIRRITALEPSGRLWGRDTERLASADAQYVEVIHTNSVYFGIDDPLGDTDFYPNGGDSQPGCLFNGCSHDRAVELMAVTITRNHLIANQCDTIRDVRRDRCSGPLLPMGNSDLNKTGYGLYRVNTDRRYPF